MSIEHAKEATSTVGYDEDNWDITNPDKNKLCPNGNPLVNFAGRNWWVNYWCNWSDEWKVWWTYVWGGNSKTNPELNSNFDPKRFFNITKDSDGTPLLELKTFKPGPNDAWITSELVLEDILGYGHYAVTAKATDFGKLDPWVVFGVFTYQWGKSDENVDKNRHREIDMLETIAGARQTNDNNNAQFALQPASANPHDGLIGGLRFTIPPNTPYITLYMKRKDPHGLYEGKEVDLAIYAGDYKLDDILNKKYQPFKTWTQNYGTPSGLYPNIPLHTTTSCERMHINLYVPGGGFDNSKPGNYNPDKAPKSPQSVFLKRFEYKEDHN